MQLSHGLSINVAPSGGTQLVAASNLQLVGGFRVPAALIDGKNTRYTSGSFDNLSGKWILTHGVSHRIAEFTEPGPMGTGSPTSWPQLVLGRNGLPFETVDDISAEGVQWIDSDRALCSGRKHYRSGFEANWMCEWNLATGVEQLIPLENPAFDENANFHMMQAFGMGFCRIPQAFADANTGGRTIGIGRGGYDVLGSPMGPALAAFDLADPWPQHTIIDYDYTQDQFAPRDGDYQFPSSPSGKLGFWEDPVGGVGSWLGGDCSQPAWVNHSSFRGILNCASQARGTIDYRAQGDGGSGPFFSVFDPVEFYSPNSSGGNRGGHEDEPWNQTLPPATYARVLYVYDPDNLQAEPQRYEFPLSEFTLAEGSANASFVRGLFWDNERQLLWACITNIHTNSKYAVLAAYQLGGV